MGAEHIVLALRYNGIHMGELARGQLRGETRLLTGPDLGDANCPAWYFSRGWSGFYAESKAVAKSGHEQLHG